VATLPVFGSGAPRFFSCFFLFFLARAREDCPKSQ